MGAMKGEDEATTEAARVGQFDGGPMDVDCKRWEEACLCLCIAKRLSGGVLGVPEVGNCDITIEEETGSVGMGGRRGITVVEQKPRRWIEETRPVPRASQSPNAQL